MWLTSVLAMLCWSGSDIFSKAGTKLNDKRSHYKVGIAVGLIMGLHALYMITFGGSPFSFSDILVYLPASVFYIASMLIGYIGLRYIELSISSPICNASGALVAIMAIFTAGESYPPLVLGAIGLVCVGVIHLFDGGNPIQAIYALLHYVLSFPL